MIYSEMNIWWKLEWCLCCLKAENKFLEMVSVVLEDLREWFGESY